MSGFRIINGAPSNGEGGLSNGGGIQVLFSNLTIDRTTISSNSADSGGGIFSASSTLTVRNSTISGNSAVDGGGIYTTDFEGPGVLNIINSTISGNSATGNGGGIYNSRSTGQILFSTISNNSAQFGGGLYSNDGESGNTNTIRVQNSIVAGNQATEDSSSSEVANIGSGGFVSGGNNLVGQNGTVGGFPTIASDIILTRPIGEVLGPLADNGGPTQTQALLAGSPAIDAGTPVDGITTDQRGESRPQGNAPDIGAFEVQPSPSPSPSPSRSPDDQSPTS
ncbi:MAG: hypothetical protein HC852_10160, partial [Acaryochloridaceae cyanobacterium RU_4_10]|nr:hypothetical protein [Acaryochloridaceae cyanobacterium RU_4_10]